MNKKQYEEAILRIEQLGLWENVLENFKQGNINKSETVNLPGMIYGLKDYERELVENWQAETGNLAYHVIREDTSMGEMYSILYVSKYEDEWDSDRQDLLNETAIAYCGLGLDRTYFEYGYIGVKPVNGGLQRLW